MADILRNKHEHQHQASGRSIFMGAWWGVEQLAGAAKSSNPSQTNCSKCGFTKVFLSIKDVEALGRIHLWFSEQEKVVLHQVTTT